MKALRISVVLMMLICSVSAANAQTSTPVVPSMPALDGELKDLCNSVMMNIYAQIMKNKGKFKELAEFDEDALYQNKYGVYSIVYEYKAEGEEASSSFGLTIDGLKDATFPARPGSFNFAFPLLGVKFSGYQRKHLLRTHFDLLPVVNNQGAILDDYQQKFMPLRLSLKPLRDVYRTREDVEFEVTLANVSKRHMVVKSLTLESLYFLIDNMAWGSSGKGKVGSLVLKAGESKTMRFKIGSFQKPKDVQLYCAYQVGIQGVYPSATASVRIIEDQDAAQ